MISWGDDRGESAVCVWTFAGVTEGVNVEPAVAGTLVGVASAGFGPGVTFFAMVSLSC